METAATIELAWPVIDANGRPLRIDHAYSWETPLSAHGMMHMVITHAANRDPYPIDTLILFMANMAWNSTMNTPGIRELLAKKEADGAYSIPFLVVVDAFQSETVSFADLVLPDTTYLERYDAISLLDRPISEPDAASDAIRHPIVAPDRDVRAWQEVLVELASRLKFPAFTKPDGARKFSGYKDFIVNYEKLPGIGFLAGWRGKDGRSPLRGEPIQGSGKPTSSTSLSSPIRGRSTCAITGTSTATISSSRSGMRCSGRRPCR